MRLHLNFSKWKSSYVLFLFLTLTAHVRKVIPEAFTATANLLQLVKAEEDILPLLEKFVQEEEEKLNELEGYIDEIEARPEYEKEHSGGLFYAGHPINSYNLIKRWYRMAQMSGSSATLDELVSKIKELPLPTDEDFEGANAAILRLQRVYELDVEDILSGQVLGYQSIHRPSNEDTVMLGETAVKTADYGLAVQWFLKAEQLLTDPILIKRIRKGLTIACEQISDFSCAAKYSKLAVEADPGDETSQETLKHLQNVLREKGAGYIPEFNGTTWMRPIPDWRYNYEKLCRGGSDATTDPEYSKNLICFYKKGIVPYVQYKHEVLSWEPRIGMFYDVISDAEADQVIERAYPLLTRGMVGDPKNPTKSQERISKLAWLWDHDPFMAMLSKRVSFITGLETKYNDLFASAEPFQVVNYGMGGQYEPHVDFYEDPVLRANVPNFIQGTGDRISTFLFYLTDVPVGGATVYPRVNVRVPPVKNAAAFWYNCKLSGEFDKMTEHAGCPVLIGQKWVTNKWIREYGQEFRRPCALDPSAIDNST